MFRVLAVITAFFTTCAGVSQAHAEPPWLLVTVHAQGQATAAATVRSNLRERGVDVAEGDEARRLFEQGDSSDATPIDSTDLERWASRSRAALRHLSRGEYDAARQALLEAQAISGRAAEALSRETVRARQVLDTCLFGVRASLETHDDAAAVRQARECRRLVPRMQPTNYTHTPEVRALVAEVDAQLERERAGRLRVQSRPSGCGVRVNGVFFGTTPYDVSELPRGDYRVQVECDEAHAGRVHHVTLGESDGTLEIDVAWERVVRSSGELTLEYPDAATLEQRFVGDGAELARRLGRRVLLARTRGDSVELVPVQGSGRAERAVELSATTSDAVAALGPDLPSYEPERRRRSPWVVSGLTLAGGAAVASGTLLVLRSELGRSLDGANRAQLGYLDRVQRHRAYGSALWALDATVGLAGSLGAGAAVRRANRPRLAAALGGTLGVGLTFGATYTALRTPVCYAGDLCTARDARVGRASLLAALAVPGLSMPISLLGSHESAPRLAASVRPGEVAFSLGGTLRR